MIYKGVSQ